MKTFNEYLTESMNNLPKHWDTTMKEVEKGAEVEEFIGGNAVTIKKLNSKWTKYIVQDFDFCIAHKQYEGENEILIKDSSVASQIKIIYNILSDIKKIDKNFNPIVDVNVRAPRLIRAIESAGFKRIRIDNSEWIESSLIYGIK